MTDVYDLSLKLATALAIGLLIGSERGWYDRDKRDGSRVAGIRTFSLIGLLGGVAALIEPQQPPWLLAAALLAVTVLVVAAHLQDVRKDQDVGVTTAFAMLLCFVLAAWACRGRPLPAIGLTVVVMALLSSKPLLHRWLGRVQPQEFFSTIKLLVISLVLLPLLPNKGYGPWQALNPYWIWWMVVLISSLSFAGYLAVRLLGQKKGILLTAVAGALVSSTAVTLSLARQARLQQRYRLLAAAALLASAIMCVRVLVEVAVVHSALLRQLWPLLLSLMAGLLAGALWLWLRPDNGAAESSAGLELKNPLQLAMALQFGLLLALVLVLAKAMNAWFGQQGLYALALISGLVDVDAISLSLARSARQGLPAEAASLAIVLACVSNTLVKGLLFVTLLGLRHHGRLLLGLAALLLPGLLSLLFLL